MYIGREHQWNIWQELALSRATKNDKEAQEQAYSLQFPFVVVTQSLWSLLCLLLSGARGGLFQCAKQKRVVRCLVSRLKDKYNIFPA